MWLIERGIGLNSWNGFQVREGDEIDVVKSFCPENPENLSISRVELLQLTVDQEEEKIKVIARRFKTLSIENYPGTESYKATAASEE